MRKMWSILVVVVLLTIVLAPVAQAQGPVRGTTLRPWERTCLSSGACRWYATYAYTEGHYWTHWYVVQRNEVVNMATDTLFGK